MGDPVLMPYAYPHNSRLYIEGESGQNLTGQGGITICDWFARRYNKGIVAYAGIVGPDTNASVNVDAYNFATAMLSRRRVITHAGYAYPTGAPIQAEGQIGQNLLGSGGLTLLDVFAGDYAEAELARAGLTGTYAALATEAYAFAQAQAAERLLRDHTSGLALA